MKRVLPSYQMSVLAALLSTCSHMGSTRPYVSPPNYTDKPKAVAAERAKKGRHWWHNRKRNR